MATTDTSAALDFLDGHISSSLSHARKTVLRRHASVIAEHGRHLERAASYYEDILSDAEAGAAKVEAQRLLLLKVSLARVCAEAAMWHRASELCDDVRASELSEDLQLMLEAVEQLLPR